MSSVVDLLSGKKVLEEVESPVNGKLSVIRDLAWGVHILGGGLTQSGGVAEQVWKTSLGRVLDSGMEVRNALILGLGGGSIAKLIRQNWGVKPKITGVDIDPVMVELGKRYLGLDEAKVEITIEDGFSFVREESLRGKHYSLVCIDTYVQDRYPEIFITETFLRNVGDVLDPRGKVVFNRLYYGEKRKEAEDFERTLERVFGNVERVYPEANVMFIVGK